MYESIKLARQALMLFLQSLDFGSFFNICSYGTDHEFLFKEGSVQYNENNLNYAISLVKNFEADFGGTEIYEPIDVIFKQISVKKLPVNKTHIYLLTDGAVHNTAAIIDLIKHNCGPLSNV